MASSFQPVPSLHQMLSFQSVNIEDDAIVRGNKTQSHARTELFLEQGKNVAWVEDGDLELSEEEFVGEDGNEHLVQSTLSSALSWSDEIFESHPQEASPHPPINPSMCNRESPVLASQQFIDLTDIKSTESPKSDPSRTYQRESRKRRRSPQPFNTHDYMTDEEFSAHLKCLRLSISDENPRQARRSRTDEMPHELKTSFCIVRDGREYQLRSGKTVELVDKTFLRIDKIWSRENGTVMLTGKHLVRQNSLSPKMPQCRGELVWTVEAFTRRSGEREVIEQITVDVEKVLQFRRVLFTNATYPEVSRKDPYNKSDYSQVLFCRWKLVTVDRDRDFMTETSIERLSYTEADPTVRIVNAFLRSQWRDTTKLGGSFARHRVGEDFVDLEGGKGPTTDHFFTGRGRSQMYTLGDCFCGAGGVSRGGKQAGLHVAWGFDHDEAAMRSYQSNFERDGTLCLCKDISDFLHHARGLRYRVDILHASPPCQPYSAAHTTSQNIQRDEANQAVLFSIQQLVESTQPRIATMEETEGLYARHPQYFFSLIHTFVHLGYSVRWKVINTYLYGIPQTRRRVYIFAAGPGETLPSFPSATHGITADLLPHETIASTISHIPRYATHHDTTSAYFRHGPKRPFNPHGAAYTLTCGGGEYNYHPSGKRPYTVREMASLQTFPIQHSFADNGRTAAKKQVGNAVPPRLAKLFFKACVKSLRESDENEIAAHNATNTSSSSSSSPPPPSSSSSSSTALHFARTAPNQNRNNPILIDNNDDLDEGFTFISQTSVSSSQPNTSSGSGSRSGSSEDDYIFID